MSFNEGALRSLREAVRLSPDNVPLRLHLGQTLLGLGQFAEAEQELRAALAVAPDHAELKLALAQAYEKQEKLSQAIVVVEDLLKSARAPAAGHVLYARLLLRRGDVPNAVAQYKLGIEKDASAADTDLAGRLGIGADETGEVWEGRVREREAGEPSFAQEIERPKLTFADVGGMDALKEEISLKIIYPLKHPELYRAYGKTMGGGILMYGPPGCGKTYLARATAGEIAASFLSVGISDVLEMWIGSSERNLHDLFDQARSNRPCVLFFDEVDALGGRRSDIQGGSARHIVNQFLAEMDGMQGSNEGVLVLAATNAPWHVDAAFRRPGRFDRVLFVPPPDRAARASILRIQCVGKPQHDLDFDRIAAKTDHFSGADLKAIVDQAIEAKLREALRTGTPQPIGTGDLLAAAKGLRPTTKEWFATARNYAVYSNQGGTYDDVLRYLGL